MKRTSQILAIGGLVIAAQTAYGKPAFLRKARDLNLPGITSCAACHISTEKPDVQWNERGLWLKARKTELKANEVDVTWLKDYRPAG